MKHTRRILSLLMALLLVFALAPAETLVPVAHAVTQEQIDNLKGAAKELANESSKLKLQRYSAQEPSGPADRPDGTADRQHGETDLRL